MKILVKTVELPNGVIATHHKIIGIKTKPDLAGLEVHVGSWPSLTAMNSGKPAAYNHYIETAIHNLIDIAEADIITLEPLVGATAVEGSTPLEIEKSKKWSEIKLKRDKVEYGGFMWDGSPFDSDPAAQSRIQGGVQLAQIATQASQPFSITWTLLDNTSRILDGAQMLAVGLALAEHVKNTHQIARVLREAIDNANSIEELGPITWPA